MTEARLEEARVIARRLIGGAGSDRNKVDAGARNTAAACDLLYPELSRWVGPDGCHALFTRALSKARVSHSLLQKIELRQDVKPYVHGVSAAVEAYGNDRVGDALEAIVVNIVDLLGRLVGDDMAAKLIQMSSAAPESGGKSSTAKRGQA